MAANTTRVLLIEDNPDDAILIQSELAGAKRESFVCQWVDRLSAGLGYLSEGNVDVVLLDLFLPDSQGVESLIKLHEAEPEVPVILLTGLDDEESAVRAAQLGAQDYLVKGQVNINLLSRSIRYAIERARLRSEAVRHILENSELKNAILQERNRLARDLHDSVSQSIYSLTLWAEAGRRLVVSGYYDQVEDYLQQIGGAAQQALKEMRLLVYELRPLELAKLGLMGALQQRLDAVEQRGGIDANLLVHGEVDLNESQEYELLQIAQEALNNILKHAQATSVTIDIDATSEWIYVNISDNGRGFDSDQPSTQAGMGLIGMRERVRHLGGEINIESTSGQGTKVNLKLPLTNAT